jgi:excisionase family DNA binding protein
MEREDKGGTMYTIKETAVRLRVSTKTIRNWISQGKLRARRIGRPLLISEADIQTALKERENVQQNTGE